jgi:hypothetical protein
MTHGPHVAGMRVALSASSDTIARPAPTEADPA